MQASFHDRDHERFTFETEKQLLSELKRFQPEDKYVVIIKYNKTGETHDGYCSDPGEIENFDVEEYTYVLSDEVYIENPDEYTTDNTLVFENDSWSCQKGSGYCGCKGEYTNVTGLVFNMEKFQHHDGNGDFLTYYTQKYATRDSQIKERRERYNSLTKIAAEQGGKVSRCRNNICLEHVVIPRDTRPMSKFCDKCFREEYPNNGTRMVTCNNRRCFNTVTVTPEMDQRLGRWTGRFCGKCRCNRF